jgi:ABC-type branched-subunit amino acid transport system ATPase component
VADQNLNFVLRITDRIYIMDSGRIRRTGARDEIKKEDIEAYIAL